MDQLLKEHSPWWEGRRGEGRREGEGERGGKEREGRKEGGRENEIKQAPRTAPVSLVLPDGVRVSSSGRSEVTRTVIINHQSYRREIHVGKRIPAAHATCITKYYCICNTPTSNVHVSCLIHYSFIISLLSLLGTRLKVSVATMARCTLPTCAGVFALSAGLTIVSSWFRARRERRFRSGEDGRTFLLALSSLQQRHDCEIRKILFNAHPRLLLYCSVAIGDENDVIITFDLPNKKLEVENLRNGEAVCRFV